MRAGTRLLIEEIRKCADSGMTRREAAAAVGCCYVTVVNHSLDHGIEWKRQPDRRASSNRNRVICERYLAGEKQIDLAAEFGISRERVRQLIEKAGLVSETKRHEDFMATVAGTVARRGLTLGEAAEFFNTAKLNVYNYCRRHDVEPARMTAEEAAELDALAAAVVNGKSIRQAAGGDNSKAEKVRRHLIKNGIKARGRSRHDNFDERRKLLTEWRGDGLTWRECADRLTRRDGRKITPTGVMLWARNNMPELMGPESSAYRDFPSEHSVTLQ